MPPSGASARQLCAAVLAAMLLPVAVLTGRLSWPWVALGAAGSCLYYYNVGRRPVGQPPQSAVFRIARAVRALGLLILCGLLSAQIGTLFPQTEGLSWAGLGVLALATVCARRGLAAVLRCGCVLLAPIALILGAAPLLALPSVRPENLLPAGSPLQAAEALGIFLLPSFAADFSPQLHRHDAKPLRWMLPGGIAAVLVSAVTAGVLSPALAGRPMGFYTLSRSISVFGVMLRLEIFVSGALTACAFVGMGLLLCAAETAAGELLSGERSCLPILGGICGLISLLPSGFLLPAARVASIFCVGFSVLTQALVGSGRPQKKFNFFGKKC